MFCDPNILRHDSDSSSKGATCGMGLGRVKTPTFNLRVETPSRFRKFENQKRLRPLLREADRENNSAHSWLVHVFTHPGSSTDFTSLKCDVRCSPESRHGSAPHGQPHCVNSTPLVQLGFPALLPFFF